LNGSGIIIGFVMMLLSLLSYYCLSLVGFSADRAFPASCVTRMYVCMYVCIIVITSLKWTFSNREADTSIDSRELRPFATLDSRLLDCLLRAITLPKIVSAIVVGKFDIVQSNLAFAPLSDLRTLGGRHANAIASRGHKYSPVLHTVLRALVTIYSQAGLSMRMRITGVLRCCGGERRKRPGGPGVLTVRADHFSGKEDLSCSSICLSAYRIRSSIYLARTVCIVAKCVLLVSSRR
jgi:hypothetical protein